jgi:hypothetical protein
MKDTGRPLLKQGEKVKTRGKYYIQGKVIDITDMDSQLICRVFDHNNRAEEVATKIRKLLQDTY